MATTTIPVTELRNFYWFLRQSSLRYVINPMQKLMIMNGKPSSEAVEMLAGLFHRSVNQFSRYNNLKDEFLPESRKSPQEDGQKDQKFAQHVVDLLKRGDNIFGYTYVDCEISPLRTTGAGEPDSGAGGLDFLAATRDSPPLPIVGEVKADNDRTPLFALIQALTYTSELATKNQLDRLHRVYEKHFAVTPERVEIVLIVEATNSPEKKQRYDEVCHLVEALMQDKEKRIASKVRAIHMLWGTATEKGSFETNSYLAKS